MANDSSMGTFSGWQGQPVQWQDPSAGSQTYQTGDRSGGKHGIKGARERLWSNEFGGGFLDRQILPPELMAQLSQQYSLPESPATTLSRAGIEQAGRQAFSLAASGGGSPAQNMWMAQNANNQAALSMLPQYAAMNADWEAQQFNMNLQRQQLLGQLGLGEQTLNDAAALSREQLLQNYVNSLYQGNLGQQQADKNFWTTLAGATLTAAGTIGGAFIGGPAGAAGGFAAGSAAAKGIGG
jgi:hypothetical protein